MFGQHPTFGRWVSSSFGTGFGTNTSTTGFGSSSFGRPAFGTPQTTASTTPFGSSAATGTTSLFGQTQPSTVYLGLNRDSWRGPCLNANQNQNRPFSFGTTTTSSGGTGANLFGTNNATSGTNLFSSGIGQTSGTVIKYNPVSGTDTMTRGGTTTNIQTKIEVITAMREFENRSLEELRVEDYLAGRKGPQQQQQQQQGFGFGQMGQQNKFGLNQPTTSSSWLSGSNTGGGGGLFGAKTQETKPLFGTNQTPVGFGTSTSGGGGGLFGSSIASPFGQSTTAPSTGVSFGQNNQNKGFSFGQTTSAATIFGQTNPVTQSGGSAFGSSAFNFENRLTYPRPTFSFDHFGNSAAIASPFGTTNTSTTGGFFGSANQNKTGFSLGTSNTGFGSGASTFGSGGLFGANNNQVKSGGLTFGSTGGFGNNPSSSGFSFSQPNTGGGLFGNTQGSGGGLFGNTNTNLNTGNSFGGGGGFGLMPMQPNMLGSNLNFNNNSNNNNVANNNINNLIKALTHNPFGISSLLKDVTAPTGKADELLNSPTNSSANNANSSKASVSDRTPTYVLPSGSTAYIKPKPVGHNRLSNLKDDSKKNLLFVGLDDKIENSPDDPFKIKPFPSVKRLNLKVFKNSKNSANNSASGTGQNSATNSIVNENLNSSTSFTNLPNSPVLHETPTSRGSLTPLHENSPTPDIIKGRGNIKRLQIPNKYHFNDTLADLNVKLSSTENAVELDASDCNKENNISIFDPPSMDDLQDIPDNANTSTAIPHPAGIKLSRAGYYAIPSMDDLKEMIDSDGNCFVENFTVGRYGYGNICFQGITNVTGLDLDSFVFIVRKEVEVYPEGVTKPPVGEELNKTAYITLDCVWPVDKCTHEVIKCQGRLDAMGWPQYLEKQCLKMEATFIEYRPETGSWVFKVKHFSKYGLQDDENEPVPSTQQPQQANVDTLSTKVAPSQKEVSQSNNSDLSLKSPLALSNFPSTLPLFGGRGSQGPPAMALTSPPQHANVLQYGSEAASTPIRRKTFLDGSVATDDFAEEIFTTVAEEPSECASLCPLSPSAERLTLSTKAPPRAIQSLKSQLFFSDLETEVTNEDDYQSFGYPREKSEKRELMGEDLVGPSMTKKLLISKESPIGEVSMNEVLKPPSVTDTKEITTDKTKMKYSSYSEIQQVDIEAVTSKANLRDPRSEYQLLTSTPDPYFELGKEVTSHLASKIPFEESLASKVSNGMADAGVFMGRSFRVGWGPCLTLVHGGRPLGSMEVDAVEDTKEEEEDDSTADTVYLFSNNAEAPEVKHREIMIPVIQERYAVTIEKLHLREHVEGSDETNGKGHIGSVLEACLQNVLECSVINYPDKTSNEAIMETDSPSKGEQQSMLIDDLVNTCHSFAPEKGINLLHRLVLTASQLDSHNEKGTGLTTVFDLCAALWGRLDFYSPDADGESDYALEQARKEAVSVWLEEVNEKTVEVEAERAILMDSEEAYLEAVFAHLTARQISKACQVCLDKGDLHLALLLSQICLGDDCPRQIMREQLVNWAWSGLDAHMSTSRLALYSLLSGKAIHESSMGSINTCLGLDWRRCMAIHMWYVSPTTSSIAEVIKEYEFAAGITEKSETPYCEEPKPSYLANHPLPENIKTNNDVCYQLLKLYVDRSHSLETLLETSAYTSDPLDITTSWMLWCILQSLEYTLLPVAKIEALHTSMAALLESMGSWHWAAFVILTLKDGMKRKRELMELLTRHLLVEGEEGSLDPFFIEKEHFILRELRVPEQWVHRAKSIRAKSLNLVDEEAWYLIKAGEYNDAHKIILNTIAPNAVINEDHEFLLSYLNEFKTNEVIEKVVDWQNGGAIYQAYLEVIQQVNELRESRQPTASKVEKLRPRLMALCLRLNNLKFTTAVHRLCISEMSRMVVSVLRAILSDDPEGIRVLAQQLTSLPVTHECALEELSHITHQYLTTLAYHTPMETT